MQKKTNWLAISFVVMTLLAIGILSHDLMETPQTVIPEGYVSPTELQSTLNNEITNSIEDKDTQISDLMEQISNLTSKVVEETKELAGYLIDGLFLSSPLDEKTYSDREVKTLFDGKVYFDGDSYDAEETITLSDIELKANGHDFEGNIYMTIPSDSVSYKLTFEDELDLSSIDGDEDKTLNFNFLGEEYEVSNWDTTNMIVTLTKGIEKKFNVGDTFVFEGRNIVLDAISESESVAIMVDGVTKVISEGSTKTVNGVEIKVDTVFYPNFAVLIIGNEVESVIEDGEEYEEDSVWNWVITENSIGIVLDEDFTSVDLDGDEEFQAIAVDSKFCLPNEYVCIKFDGMSEEDYFEYNLRLDERDGNDYVRIDGDFQSGTKDYTRIYVNVSDGKIYDKDLELIDDSEIELSDTDSILDTSSGKIVIEDFEVEFTLDDASDNGDSLNSFDEKYTTVYGITLDDPENMVEENKFVLSVPSEKIEGSMNLI